MNTVKLVFFRKIDSNMSIKPAKILLFSLHENSTFRLILVKYCCNGVIVLRAIFTGCNTSDSTIVIC